MEEARLGSIMAIKVNGRVAKAPLVQEILTEYGCNIRTRVGFHEASEDFCGADGILILQLVGDKEEIQQMYEKLKALDGVKTQFIEF